MSTSYSLPHLRPFERHAPAASGDAVECPVCAYESPAGAKFCNMCGAPVYLVPCPACEAINARTSPSCYRCGTTIKGSMPRHRSSPPEGLTSSNDAAVEETVLAAPQSDVPAFALGPTIASTPAEAPLSATSPHTTRRRIAAIVTFSVVVLAIAVIALFPHYRSAVTDPVTPPLYSKSAPVQPELPDAPGAPSEKEAVRAAAQPSNGPNAQPTGEAVPDTAATSSAPVSASPALSEANDATDSLPAANASAPAVGENATASGHQPAPLVTDARTEPQPNTARSTAKARPSNRISAVQALPKPASPPIFTAPAVAKPPKRQAEVRIAQPKGADSLVPCNDAAVVLGFCSRQ